jgi:hydrogenase expression/formation protein HypC
MLQHEQVEVGDHVVVHVGYAIQKVSAAEARTAWEIYDEMLAREAEQDASDEVVVNA